LAISAGQAIAGTSFFLIDPDVQEGPPADDLRESARVT